MRKTHLLLSAVRPLFFRRNHPQILLQTLKNKHSATPSDTPIAFVTQHQPDVIGVLSGFDRLRLKGSLPPLYYPRTMDAYLQVKGILFKDVMRQ
jgi:hypothetical protein